MKRSWLIGAALVFSLTAVGCKDDDDEDAPVVLPDGSVPDSGTKSDASVITPMDGSVGDSGMDATAPISDAGHDAGDAK